MRVEKRNLEQFDNGRTKGRNDAQWPGTREERCRGRSYPLFCVLVRFGDLLFTLSLSSIAFLSLLSASNESGGFNFQDK